MGNTAVASRIVVDAALTRPERVGKAGFDAGHLGEPPRPSHFMPPVIGQGQRPLRGDAVEHGSESSDCRSRSCMIHFCQCDKERASHNQRANGRRIARTLVRSPSQWPGMTRSSISGGRIWMLIMFGMVPRRSAPRARGRRRLRAWRWQAIYSVRNSPRGMA